MLKLARYLLVITLLATAAYAAWSYRNKWTSKPSVAITTESVHLGDIEQTVLANGTLKPFKLVAVGAQLSGRLISLDVKVGQNIRKGDGR